MWATQQIRGTQEGDHCSLKSIASWSEAQVTTWTCNWWSRTELFFILFFFKLYITVLVLPNITCGIRHYLQVDKDRIEMSYRTPIEKEMATHSSIPAWRNPWTQEPGRLQSMESQRVRHDWLTKHKYDTQLVGIQELLVSVGENTPTCTHSEMGDQNPLVLNFSDEYQEWQEKNQQPQICIWYHSDGRKWRGIKEPLKEGERGDWKSWLKVQREKKQRS